MKKLLVLFLFSIIFLTNCTWKHEEPKPTGLIKLLDSPVKFEIYGKIDTFNKINDTVYIQKSRDYADPAPGGHYFISSSAESGGIREAILVDIYSQNDLEIISKGKDNSVYIGEDNQFNNVTIENSSN